MFLQLPLWGWEKSKENKLAAARMASWQKLRERRAAAMLLWKMAPQTSITMPGACAKQGTGLLGPGSGTTGGARNRKGQGLWFFRPGRDVCLADGGE